MDANAAPPEPPAGAEAVTEPLDANAAPPAPPADAVTATQPSDANATVPGQWVPLGGLLETVREERQQDRKIRLLESLSRTGDPWAPDADVDACGTKDGYGSA